jgi:DNA-binding CsgD family transcriptional regulator
MNRFKDLSDRQAECLRLVGNGLNAKQIASRLDLSHETVNAHLKAARRTMGVGRSLDAARLLIAAEQAEAGDPPSESMGNHSMVIANSHPAEPFPSHQASSADGGDGVSSFELRGTRTAFLFEEDASSVGQAAMKARFGDLSPARRMLIIIAVMIGCVVTVAGLAAIAGSLQTILWSIKSGH